MKKLIPCLVLHGGDELVPLPRALLTSTTMSFLRRRIVWSTAPTARRSSAVTSLLRHRSSRSSTGARMAATASRPILLLQPGLDRRESLRLERGWVAIGRFLPVSVGSALRFSSRSESGIWLAVTLTYDQAVAQGRGHASSPVFNYTQLLSTPPAASDTWMVNFTMVPEPSVIGLAMVGAGALFLLRHRVRRLCPEGYKI